MMNYQTIDCAWRSRVHAFYQGDKAAAIIARAENREPRKVVKAAEYVARPFDFADLQGKAEPEKWGPCYPKTASAKVEAWRRLARIRELTGAEKLEHGAAVGEWIRNLNSIKPAAKVSHKYVMPNYAAINRAAFAAAAGRDRREWADGKAKSGLVGSCGLTIAQAYAAAMAEKAARLAGEPVEAPKRLNEQPQRYPIARPARAPRKAAQKRAA